VLKNIHKGLVALAFLLAFSEWTIAYSATVTLSMPADNTVLSETSVMFQWASFEGARSYRLQVSSDAGFQELLLEYSLDGSTTRQELAGLPADGSFTYWRVKCFYYLGGYKETSWSNVRTFTRPVSIPYVVSLHRTEAVNEIQRVGLTLNSEIEEYSDYVPVNHVISQEPSTGKIVKRGTNIQLTISKGPVPGAISTDEQEGETEVDNDNNKGNCCGKIMSNSSKIWIGDWLLVGISMIAALILQKVFLQ
jgi:hypothetical protein